MKKTIISEGMRQFWLAASVVCYLLLLFFCFDSLNYFCFLSLVPIVPIKTYFNAESEKSLILKENKNKSGIYMWKNSINDKRYIGSAVDLSNRLSSYYYTTYMEDALKRSNSHIYRALLKNGHSKFSLEIIEYCSPDKCLEREDFYLSYLKPEYNLNNKATAPFSGRIHSDDTKIIMSDAKKGEKNPNYGKTLNNETKTKISDAAKKSDNSGRFKPGQQRPVGAGKASQVIEVTDIKNNTRLLIIQWVKLQER